MFEPNKIIVHHSLTKDNQTVSWGAIRRYHTETLGWSDIGYHAGVELVYTEYEMFIGREWDKTGAHTIGENTASLGICFVGNYDAQPPPDRMLEIGAKVIRMWMKLYGIPKEMIFGHNKYASYKTCPGEKFDIEELKKWL